MSFLHTAQIMADIVRDDFIKTHTDNVRNLIKIT